MPGVSEKLSWPIGDTGDRVRIVDRNTVWHTRAQISRLQYTAMFCVEHSRAEVQIRGVHTAASRATTAATARSNSLGVASLRSALGGRNGP